MSPERADTSPVAELLPDPAARLAEGFRTIATTRMAGLPFLNPALEVESVGFAPWEGRWLGVVVTPWFINLILAPQDPARWTAVAPGAKTSYLFPAGRYEFIGVSDDLLGEYQMCSLFSPVNEIADHATAVLIAQLARAALFDPEHAIEEPGTPLTPEPAIDDNAPGLQEKLEAKLDQPMSKRGFLSGAFLKNPDEPRG
ncbi:MAG: [NiFe]-hydrogenase assembly chaperone HybE [Burkholderiaceae bacterium]